MKEILRDGFDIFELWWFHILRSISQTRDQSKIKKLVKERFL
jgi:hypothetical protein